MKCVFNLLVFCYAQLKQTEGQSEVAKQRELQRKIEQLRAEISHLDSQISGTEEQLATQGKSVACSLIYFHFLIFKVISCIPIFYCLPTEQSISHTWAQVEDSQRRELLLQAFRQRCTSDRKVLSDDTQKISGHCKTLEQMAR